MDVVRAERPQPRDQRVAGRVEALVDVLEAVRRDRLDADERALDAGPAHGVEELVILGGLHRDLREEHHVGRQLGQPPHQVEAVVAHGLQFEEPGAVRPPARLGEVGLRDGVEVVVGQRDEPEAEAAQLARPLRRPPHCRARRGAWPSVRHTEQNEQCFGQPRTVCTDAHMYLPRWIRSHRAWTIWSPGTRPASYIRSGASVRAIREDLAAR